MVTFQCIRFTGNGVLIPCIPDLLSVYNIQHVALNKLIIYIA